LLGLLDEGGSSLKKISRPMASSVTSSSKPSPISAQSARHRRQSRGQIPGARKIWPRSHRTRAPGKIDPVIGRDEEIRRVMQVLTRRTKNNPVLIGEPGVGKTAIAEASPAASSAVTFPKRSNTSVSSRWI